jgi:hypothetical protein
VAVAGGVAVRLKPAAGIGNVLKHVAEQEEEAVFDGTQTAWAVSSMIRPMSRR